MHFRQFLISALMVGAAMFFPDDAFAEKNELHPQKGAAPASVNSEKESGKIEVLAKAEQEKSQTQTIPEQALENQAQAKQLSAQNTPNEVALEKRPNQAKGNVNSEGKKAEKAIQVNVDEEVADIQVNHRVDKPISNRSLEATDNQVEDKQVQHAVNTLGNDTVIIETESFAQEPQKEPASKEQIPKVNQVLNQTQRSNNSGGQSNDRINQGLYNINLLDKWFEWNHYFEIKLVQPYLSRQALLNTQWVNAPPSPPPQAALLLTNVTRS